jgi:hypothetical protein
VNKKKKKEKAMPFYVPQIHSAKENKNILLF